MVISKSIDTAQSLTINVFVEFITHRVLWSLQDLLWLQLLSDLKRVNNTNRETKNKIFNLRHYRKQNMCKGLCRYKLTNKILNECGKLTNKILNECGNFVSVHSSGCCARNSNWRYSRQTAYETLTPNSSSDSKYLPNC